MTTTIEMPVIARAAPADEAAIRNLLAAEGLPHGDIGPHLQSFLVARDRGVVVGAVGVEICGQDALLRSLVVSPAFRGAGLGNGLVAAIVREAAGQGVKRLWLLTTDAVWYFAARGFRTAGRESAPPSIRATGQFSGVCCSSAVCMTREVGPP